MQFGALQSLLALNGRKAAKLNINEISYQKCLIFYISASLCVHAMMHFNHFGFCVDFASAWLPPRGGGCN